MLTAEKLHVHYLKGATSQSPLSPRRYTLTHSDSTGDMFLAIGADYDRRAISGWYTRLMRDEVLAEWLIGRETPVLHVYCHVSGGLVFGSAAWRDGILRHHMPDVLQAFRYGDRMVFEVYPELDTAPVIVHFRASQVKYNRAERWGQMGDHRFKQ